MSAYEKSLISAYEKSLIAAVSFVSNVRGVTQKSMYAHAHATNLAAISWGTCSS